MIELPVRVVTCASSGDTELIQLNPGRLACRPNQKPLLSWCTQKEEAADQCSICVKPPSF